MRRGWRIPARWMPDGAWSISASSISPTSDIDRLCPSATLASAAAAAAAACAIAPSARAPTHLTQASARPAGSAHTRSNRRHPGTVRAAAAPRTDSLLPTSSPRCGPRRRWNGLVKHWRRCLHEYDLPPPVPSSAAATVGDRAARAAPAAPDVERRAAAWDAVEKDEETPDAGDGEAAHAGVDGLALGMEPCTGVESAVVELGAMDATDDMLAWVSAELGWPDPSRDSRLAQPAAAGSGHGWGGGSGGWR